MTGRMMFWRMIRAKVRKRGVTPLVKFGRGDVGGGDINVCCHAQQNISQVRGQSTLQSPNARQINVNQWDKMYPQQDNNVDKVCKSLA